MRSDEVVFVRGSRKVAFQTIFLLQKKTPGQNRRLHHLTKTATNFYKPDSVCPVWPRDRLSFIWDIAHAIPLSANPRTSDEQSSIIRLFGISARKVYPNSLLPKYFVGSYPTFSPLPLLQGGYFLWHYLYPEDSEPHPLGGALLYAVRTFLPCIHKGDNPSL